MARTNDVWETGATGTYIQTIAPSGFDILINGTNKYINFNTTVGSTGYGIRDNGGTMEFKNSGGSWTAMGSGGGGSSTFIGLTDVPASYTGASLKIVRVNAGETALEFATLPGGGDALTSDPLSQFAATTSAQLASIMTDETGTGSLVFANTPTLVTPILGVATATSINGLTITTSTGTLTIANSKTATISNTLTFTGTDGSSVAFGAGGTVAYLTTQLDQFAAPTSSVSMNGQLITNLASPVSGNDAVNKSYADALAAGLKWKTIVDVATTANITLSGEQTIDGVLTSASRVLVKNQTTASENGVYISAAGAWARSTDADTGAELEAAAVPVNGGTVNAGRAYVQTSTSITIGVTSIVFVQFLNTTYSGTTNRITVSTNVIDIAATYVGQTSITTLGTVATGTWNATVIGPAYGGTGVANNAASTWTISGNFATTITVSATTTVTLPTSGTLYGTATGSITSAQLAGSLSDETGTGKVVFSTAPTFDSTMTIGTAGGTTGAINMKGTTSGTVTITTAAAAGTWTFTLPTGAGTNGYVLSTNGSGVTSWVAAGTGTVTATAGSLTSNAVVLGAGTTDTKVSTGITTDGTAKLILGVNTTTMGTIKMFGSTSGDVTITPTAVAGTATVWTLPATSDTFVGLAIAQTFTKAQRGAFVTLTDAATVAVDLSLANNFFLVLGGNRTLGTPTNPVAGQTGVISVMQDSTGSRTLAYAWPYQFAGGTAPTLTTGKFSLDQLYYSVNKYATATVTISNASPGVITWTGHGLSSGDRIQLTTTGSLPTGLTASTTYWITVIDANSFKVSSSFANLQAGTFINTSSAGSGTHTATNWSITIANALAIA